MSAATSFDFNDMINSILELEESIPLSTRRDSDSDHSSASDTTPPTPIKATMAEKTMKERGKKRQFVFVYEDTTRLFDEETCRYYESIYGPIQSNIPKKQKIEDLGLKRIHISEGILKG